MASKGKKNQKAKLKRAELRKLVAKLSNDNLDHTDAAAISQFHNRQMAAEIGRQEGELAKLQEIILQMSQDSLLDQLACENAMELAIYYRDKLDGVRAVVGLLSSTNTD